MSEWLNNVSICRQARWNGESVIYEEEKYIKLKSAVQEDLHTASRTVH